MVSSEYNYSHLTVQRVQVANKRNYTVLFLLTGMTCVKQNTVQYLLFVDTDTHPQVVQIFGFFCSVLFC